MTKRAKLSYPGGPKTLSVEALAVDRKLSRIQRRFRGVLAVGSLAAATGGLVLGSAAVEEDWGKLFPGIAYVVAGVGVNVPSRRYTAGAMSKAVDEFVASRELAERSRSIGLVVTEPSGKSANSTSYPLRELHIWDDFMHDRQAEHDTSTPATPAALAVAGVMDQLGRLPTFDPLAGGVVAGLVAAGFVMGVVADHSVSNHLREARALLGARDSGILSVTVPPGFYSSGTL